MNIYLIGLPGAGKTTLGKGLASKLNYHFVDLDEYIEQQAMLFIDELFMLYGEEYFRALETNCLKQVSSGDHLVISCGGGIIKRSENKSAMKGICIYLTAPLDEIERRVEGTENIRPLLQSKTIEDLYEERNEQYCAFADMQIENTDMEQAIQNIVQKLEGKL